MECTFYNLNTTFTTSPILTHLDFSKSFFMETNASYFALREILSQGGDGKVHPIAFYSKKFSIAEINYDIHDKELLAIIDLFQEWHHLLEGTSHLVIVYIDYKNLKYFISTCVLNCRQVHWNMSLCRLEFVITYWPKKQPKLLDALSKQSYLSPKVGDKAYD